MIGRPRERIARLRERVEVERFARATMLALVAPPRRSFAAYGAGSNIIPPTRVDHPECIEIGAGVAILEHAWLAVEPRPGRPAPKLVIGDGCKLNRFVKIDCLGAVTLGEGVLVADRVYIADVDLLPAPGIDDGRRLAAEPAPVTIGAKAFLGLGAIVTAGVTIGAGAYVSAGSVVVDDVPERTLVMGSPARTIRRWDGTPPG
jgi:acetyltransferase-like isoleucine patch superfamily enzyme